MDRKSAGKYAVTDVYSHGESKQTWEQLSTSPLGNLESLEMVRTIGSEAKKNDDSSWRPKKFGLSESAES